MAAIRLRLFSTSASEIERLLTPPIPRWVRRACEVERVGAAPPPPSIAVAAVGELLSRRMDAVSLLVRRAEERGWKAHFEAEWLLLVTGLAPDDATAAMKRDGTWSIARRLAEKDGAGRVVWT